MALELKLLKSVADCERAFALLDEEVERRILQKYSPAMEVKLVKEYMDWLQAGQPANDARQGKYQKMQAAFIEPIKAEYKPIRQELKAIIVPLKEEEARERETQE